MNIRDIITLLKIHDEYDDPFTDQQRASLPHNVYLRAVEMYAEVKGKHNAIGDSDVVDGYWIETHTLGCRDAGGDAEDDWFDNHMEFYDKYRNDGVSIVAGDASDGHFISITPQK